MLFFYRYYYAWGYEADKDGREIILETAREVRNMIETKANGDYSIISSDQIFMFVYDELRNMDPDKLTKCEMLENIPEEWKDLRTLTSEEYLEKFLQHFKDEYDRLSLEYEKKKNNKEDHKHE